MLHCITMQNLDDSNMIGLQHIWTTKVVINSYNLHLQSIIILLYYKFIIILYEEKLKACFLFQISVKYFSTSKNNRNKSITKM